MLLCCDWFVAIVLSSTGSPTMSCKKFLCLPCSCFCGSFSYIWHWCSLVCCCWATFCVSYLNFDHQMISSMINLFVFDKNFFPWMEILFLHFLLYIIKLFRFLFFLSTNSLILYSLLFLNWCCWSSGDMHPTSSFLQTVFHMEIVQLLCEVLLYLHHSPHYLS